MKLPDFPWDALAPYGEKAKAHPSGFIDLSQGTPVDSTPEFIQEAFKAASNSPSYPVTMGTPELREAITKWAKEQLGASGDFGVLPLIGSKESVAWLPTILESTAQLIVAPSHEVDYEQFLRRLQGVIVAREYVIVDYDCPVSIIEEASKITPGIESPTISPLRDSEWVAVRALVKSVEVNKVMDDLYALGARAILVSALHAARI